MSVSASKNAVTVKPKVAAKSKAAMSNTLVMTGKEGKSRERAIAEVGLSTVATNAITARIFTKGTFGEIDLTTSIEVLQENVVKVNEGDLSGVEATLTAQATALNAIFTELARRGALNMGEYLSSAETYIRLALKAQSQCRATLETLANIKNPPVAYVRQANIAHGPQQVNNGIPAPLRAGKTESQQSKLLEKQHGEWVDSGTTGATSRTDKAMATVGKIDGA